MKLQNAEPASDAANETTATDRRAGSTSPPTRARASLCQTPHRRHASSALVEGLRRTHGAVAPASAAPEQPPSRRSRARFEAGGRWSSAASAPRRFDRPAPPVALRRRRSSWPLHGPASGRSHRARQRPSPACGSAPSRSREGSPRQAGVLRREAIVSPSARTPAPRARRAACPRTGRPERRRCRRG